MLLGMNRTSPAVAEIAKSITVPKSPDPDSRRVEFHGRVFVAVRISLRLGPKGSRISAHDWTITEHDRATGKHVRTVAEEVVHIRTMPMIIARYLSREAA